MRNIVVTALFIALAAGCSPAAAPAAVAPAAPAAAPAPASKAVAPAVKADRAAWNRAIAEGKQIAAAAASFAGPFICDINSGDGNDKLDKKAGDALKQVASATAALERVSAPKDASDADVGPVLTKQKDAVAAAKRACEVAGNAAAKARAADHEG